MASTRVLKSLAPRLCNALRVSGARFLCENPTPRPSPKAAVQSFGVLLDIDGVLIRGRNPIPGAREALEMLQQSDVPTVFLTNGGCEFEKETAERISHRIGFEIRKEQIILSHTPLKMFDWLHDKHVLISGQGNVKEILHGYGFTKTSDMGDLKRAYPLLDMVDRATRYDLAGNAAEEFSPIEAILLLGEPVRWETNLQLIIDVLITKGCPYSSPVSPPTEHIPVVVANTDLIYVSEVPLPRFGHGAFLLSLESLYKKLTGHELMYTQILGKPYMTSYQYAEYCLNQNNNGGISGNIKSLYAVGDNLDTDIYGANLCHEYLKVFHKTNGNNSKNTLKNYFSQSKQSKMNWLPEIKRIESVLVQTGVSSQDDSKPTNDDGSRFLHRDTVYHPHLRRANHVVENIAQAVELILKQEQASSH